MPVGTVVGNKVIGTVNDDVIDLVNGGYPLNVIHADGGTGKDFIYGNNSDNILNGEYGNDYIDGGAGNDYIRGGYGIDILKGGAGNDTFALIGEVNIPGIDQPGGKSITYLGTGLGLTDTYDGGAGMDKIQATEANLTLIVKTIENVTYDSIEEIDGSVSTNFRVRILDNTVQDFTKVKLTNVLIDLGEGDDVVVGSSANQFVDTNADGTADAYNGASGNDRIEGGANIDTYKLDANFGAYTTTALGGGGMRFQSTKYTIDLLGNGTIQIADADTLTEGNTGFDILTGFEKIQFNDVTLNFLPASWQDGDATGGNTIGTGVSTIGLLSEAVNAGASAGIDINVTSSALLGGAPVTYSLASDANGAFAINPSTGVITVADATKIDYESFAGMSEENKGYTLLVQATTMGISEVRIVFVRVTDGNDRPVSATDSDGASNQVAEGAVTGTVVG